MYKILRFLTIGVSTLPVLLLSLNMIESKSTCFKKNVIMQVLHNMVFIRWFSQSSDLQEIRFLDSKSKAGLSDSLILKTEAKPIKSLLVIIVANWIQSTKTLFQPFKSCQAKFQTPNLKSRSEKANCLEQKSIISCFSAHKWGVSFCRWQNFDAHTTRL